MVIQREKEINVDEDYLSKISYLDEEEIVVETANDLNENLVFERELVDDRRNLIMIPWL